MKPSGGLWWAFAVAGSLVLGGCALDYEKEASVDPAQVPQMVFEDIHQTAVKDGQVQYTMKSASSEVYQTKKQVRLKNFEFQEYDSDGKPASRGTADSAVINTDSNDARISGRLSARSEAQAVTLEADGGTSGGLTWANDDRILKTLPETGVTLKKDDGSQIEAKALTLDLGSNRLELEDGVQGSWTAETKQDEDSAALDANTAAPPPGSSDPAPQP